MSGQHKQPPQSQSQLEGHSEVCKPTPMLRQLFCCVHQVTVTNLVWVEWKYDYP